MSHTSFAATSQRGMRMVAVSSPVVEVDGIPLHCLISLQDVQTVATSAQTLSQVSDKFSVKSNHQLQNQNVFEFPILSQGLHTIIITNKILTRQESDKLIICDVTGQNLSPFAVLCKLYRAIINAFVPLSALKVFRTPHLRAHFSSKCSRLDSDSSKPFRRLFDYSMSFASTVCWDADI